MPEIEAEILGGDKPIEWLAHKHKKRGRSRVSDAREAEACACASPALLPAENVPSNNLLHDLAGTAVDALDARVDEVAGDRVFLHVAVAAEELQALVRHFALQLGGGELGDGGVGGAEFTAVVLLDGLFAERFVDLHLGVQVGEDEAGVLEFADRLAEGLAFLGVGDGALDHAFAGGDGAERQDQAFAGQFVHQVGEAAPFPAEDLVGADFDVLEEQLGGVGGVVAHLFQVPAAGEAGQAGVDGEQGHALGAGVGVGFGGEHDDVAVLAVGDEGFLAVDHVAVAVFFGAGFHALQVGAGAGLGHADGAHGFTADHLRQPGLFLLFRAQVEDVGRDDVRVHGQVGGQGAEAHARGFFHHDRGEAEVRAETAVLFRDVNAQQAVFAHAVPEVAGEFFVLFPLIVVGRHFLLEEFADVIAEQIDFVLIEHD